MRRRARLAIAIVAVALIAAAFPSPMAAQKVKGRLVIVGGGERTSEIMDRFIELAGGRENGRFVIFPMASETPDTAGIELAAEFNSRGAKNVEWLLFTKEQASAPGFAERLNGATGIWFGGGDQVRHTAAILGTPVHAKLKELYRQGTVMGGTSAGAAIMSRIMITGDELINKDTRNPFTAIMKGNIQTVEGIGFLDNAIIDQHFVKRKRLNRLISVVLEHPDVPGIGIDEATALIVNPDGTCDVLGEGTVVVFDARRATGIHADKAGNLAARNVFMNIYSAGERFTLKSNRPAAPPPAQ
jgi:cyanophycinase